MSDTALRKIAIVDSYGDLVATLRARADELGITRETIDHLSGLQNGYSGKLLAPIPSKVFGRISFGAILGALALKVVIVEDPAQLERLRPRLTPRKRAQSARHAESPAATAP